MLKTALKTVFYAEEYHLSLVTDIYFDIFCIDCIVKKAQRLRPALCRIVHRIYILKLNIEQLQDCFDRTVELFAESYCNL